MKVKVGFGVPLASCKAVNSKSVLKILHHIEWRNLGKKFASFYKLLIMLKRREKNKFGEARKEEGREIRQT